MSQVYTDMKAKDPDANRSKCMTIIGEMWQKEKMANGGKATKKNQSTKSHWKDTTQENPQSSYS
jgi:hypothetical protein